VEHRLCPSEGLPGPMVLQRRGRFGRQRMGRLRLVGPRRARSRAVLFRDDDFDGDQFPIEADSGFSPHPDLSVSVDRVVWCQLIARTVPRSGPAQRRCLGSSLASDPLCALRSSGTDQTQQQRTLRVIHFGSRTFQSGVGSTWRVPIRRDTVPAVRRYRDLPERDDAGLVDRS
jgi:hypothetical protein